VTELGPGTRVAVIGGGIAGVAAAWSLDRAGYRSELFERGPELGGAALRVDASAVRYVDDVHQIQRIMLGRVLPDVPPRG
jgi:glycine/D-amino acid oxidase-like deaminating enzyme